MFSFHKNIIIYSIGLVVAVAVAVVVGESSSGICLALWCGEDPGTVRHLHRDQVWQHRRTMVGKIRTNPERLRMYQSRSNLLAFSILVFD